MSIIGKLLVLAGRKQKLQYEILSIHAEEIALRRKLLKQLGSKKKSEIECPHCGTLVIAEDNAFICGHCGWSKEE